MFAYHRFLCPRNALGMPVRMRMAPSTPNAGSILVSRTVGSGVLVGGGAVSFFFVAVAVGVGVLTTVTLRTTGTTVKVGTSEVPLWMVVEIVAEAVVSERDVTGARLVLLLGCAEEEEL